MGGTLSAVGHGAAGSALRGLGFAAAGPVAGSFAATWMSWIASVGGGGVKAGSLYATLQSAGMAGLSATAALTVGGVLVVGGTSLAALAAWGASRLGSPKASPGPVDRNVRDRRWSWSWRSAAACWGRRCRPQTC
ncbi:Interferon alpha-inducible protein 27-like protein 1 [Tetrabaena socialis]|uniref:Interferon alpha-inducible protein 27-like protein 1 n=1 Tax=Tetrabaena socialis TaxID=47790 RepID=A0A2J8AAD2_9CHLO|nr:Interferon alpha-inducible protein 27-like protein 1 [Tetrabaena socialis]|eukprot:PNH09479.1 Interferon alpha-inducible protein 27-like protein 1 [Tetrabaena socialis]